MCGRACVKATRQVAGSMPKKLKGETEEKERKIKYNLQEKKGRLGKLFKGEKVAMHKLT